MSKFQGIVVVPVGTVDVDGYVVEHLSQHQPEEVGTCSCVGLAASTDAREQASRQLGNDRKRWETFIETHPHYRDVVYKNWRQGRHDADFRAAVAAHERPWEQLRAELFAQHPMRRQPDPDCRHCGGSGRVKAVSADSPFESFWYLRSENVLDVIIANPPPFAVFVPSGKWAIEDDRETWKHLGASWPQAAHALLADYRDCAVAWVGFHA
jgi:hypothetical protein